MGEHQQIFDFAESLGNQLMQTKRISVVDAWINAKKADQAVLTIN